MLFKGTQFPLLQPLAEPGPSKSFGKLAKIHESLINPKAIVFFMNSPGVGGGRCWVIGCKGVM
jgi:hypothetical protein